MNLNYTPSKDPSCYVYDSRKVTPGDTYIVLPGGEPYESLARAAGADECIPMNRDQLAEFANVLYGYPSRALTVVGVTGTNGKTTVCHLVAQCLEHAGFRPAVLGTINSALTTPESLDVARLMRAHLDKGGTHFVMEVSSHGIDQGRVNGIAFDVKLLTNITQDHLDYHGTMAAYEAVKMRFMTDWPGKSILPAQFASIELGFKNPLLGEFNRRNMQAAVSILRELKVTDDQIAASMASATAPAGRFEPVDAGQEYLVIVDYAHTSDSLDNVLSTAREIADARGGRLISVFGCGGDRDRKKRPLMAAAAAKHSDYIFVTSDNPRTEAQSQITADILTGFSQDSPPHKVLEDRGTAIDTAVQSARWADVVVIAGKGHETYQILSDRTIDFDDRVVARNAILGRD